MTSTYGVRLLTSSSSILIRLGMVALGGAAGEEVRIVSPSFELEEGWDRPELITTEQAHTGQRSLKLDTSSLPLVEHHLTRSEVLSYFVPVEPKTLVSSFGLGESTARLSQGPRPSARPAYRVSGF